MASRIKNFSGGAVTLPAPYGGIIPWGGAVVVSDTPAQVAANLGNAFGNNLKISLDTVDSANPAFDLQEPAAPRLITTAVTATPATLTTKEAVALVNVASAVTINLPASPVAGETHIVKDTSGACTPAQAITVKTTDSSTIDGAAGTVGAVINAPYSSLVFVFDGTAWWSSSAVGNASAPRVVAAGSATLLHADKVCFVNFAGTVTINLPITPAAGEIHEVKDSGGHAAADAITVKTTDSSTIDGASGATGLALASTNYTFTRFISDGTNWFTI